MRFSCKVLIFLCTFNVHSALESLDSSSWKGHVIHSDLADYMQVNLPDCKNTARILSFDGGGTRGVLSSAIAESIERAADAPISSLFHMIGGTSTGGIQATALSVTRAEQLNDRYSAKYVKNIYINHRLTIFPQNCLNNVRRVACGYKYGDFGLSRVLNTYFGGAKFSELENDVVLTYMDVNRGNCCFVKSHQIQAGYAKDYYVKDVVASTTAAPTYLPAHTMYEVNEGNARNRTPHTAIDGGMFANDPAKCLLTEACSMYNNADSYLLVSIGTGTCKKNRAVPGQLLGWACNLPDILMNGNSDMFKHFVKHDGCMYRKPVIYCRLQAEINEEYSGMDDTRLEALNYLIEQANSPAITERINNIAKFLRAPKADRKEISSFSAEGTQRKALTPEDIDSMSEEDVRKVLKQYAKKDSIKNNFFEVVGKPVVNEQSIIQFGPLTNQPQSL